MTTFLEESYDGHGYALAPPTAAVYEHDGDRARQRDVAAVIEDACDCRVWPFAGLCPIDYWAEKHKRLAAVIEIKTRTHALGHYPTSYLPARKYLALLNAAATFGCAALYVVGFTDGIYAVALAKVDGRQHEIVRQRFGRGDARDVEPVILVPTDAFTKLTP